MSSGKQCAKITYDTKKIFLSETQHIHTTKSTTKNWLFLQLIQVTHSLSMSVFILCLLNFSATQVIGSCEVHDEQIIHYHLHTYKPYIVLPCNKSPETLFILLTKSFFERLEKNGNSINVYFPSVLLQWETTNPYLFHFFPCPEGDNMCKAWVLEPYVTLIHIVITPPSFLDIK